MSIFPNMLREVVIAGAVLWASIGQGFAQEPPAQVINRDLDAYATPARLVRLPDGRKLNLYCVGEGSPTVLLESGLGGGSFLYWNKVQAQLGTMTRTCAYDRAGLGFSDAGPFPRSPKRITEDLHNLLVAAHEMRPFVLVGHSQGGIYVRNYAATFPADVGGLVLIESAALGQFSRASTGPLMVFDTVVALETCKANADRGLIQLGSTCVGSIPQNYSADLSKALLVNGSKSKNYETQLSEARESLALAPDSEAKSFGNLPISILYVPHPESPEMDRAWQKQQNEFANLSTNSSIKLVPNSGHMMPKDQPAIVVEAVSALVNTLRKGVR